MDGETERKIAALILAEAERLRARAAEEGPLAYVRPHKRCRPNPQFLKATIQSVECTNRALDVREMWEQRQREVEKERHLSAKAQESHRSGAPTVDGRRRAAHAAADPPEPATSREGLDLGRRSLQQGAWDHARARVRESSREPSEGAELKDEQVPKQHSGAGQPGFRTEHELRKLLQRKRLQAASSGGCWRLARDQRETDGHVPKAAGPRGTVVERGEGPLGSKPEKDVSSVLGRLTRASNRDDDRGEGDDERWNAGDPGEMQLHEYGNTGTGSNNRAGRFEGPISKEGQLQHQTRQACGEFGESQQRGDRDEPTGPSTPVEEGGTSRPGAPTDDDSGAKDGDEADLKAFLMSRTKRGRGSVGSHMDSGGPFAQPAVPGQGALTGAAGAVVGLLLERVREEWEERVGSAAAAAAAAAAAPGAQWPRGEEVSGSQATFGDVAARSGSSGPLDSSSSSSSSSEDEGRTKRKRKKGKEKDSKRTREKKRDKKRKKLKSKKKVKKESKKKHKDWA